ncbi:spindle and kinetochore-associated protein 2 isoform X2 [Thalassophryne amazonica]|uniref:spindle and kinetochore-associated protein 2 isoform X2 n=1 Tax=Thalassophryne amazonica TaxID=390379 RepID=UPI001470FD92|nr:spindle and kinetochore-associated protein 2 isoform X2 [Thalassophryne amazonica]
METTVEKLEAMFQKSEADLDYIEKRLKLDFLTVCTESGGHTEENLVEMLDDLIAIKAKHKLLCSEFKEIAAAHQASMESIKANLTNVVQLIQQVQQTAASEVSPLTESEQKSAELLCASENTAARWL